MIVWQSLELNGELQSCLYKGCFKRYSKTKKLEGIELDNLFVDYDYYFLRFSTAARYSSTVRFKPIAACSTLSKWILTRCSDSSSLPLL